MRKQLFIAILLASFSLVASAQGPNSTGTYYKSANGKSGAALKTALAGVINGEYKGNKFSQMDYGSGRLSGVWGAFATTDVLSNGTTIRDRYSNITHYTLGDDQGSSSGSEATGGYNREHSFPKSWFGGSTAKGPGTDLFHIYPTDVWVNNMRGNLPFGENKGEGGHSSGYYSKVGECTVEGSGGVRCFEPNDEWKGDFARGYFYMVTCYESSLVSWGKAGSTINGTTYPSFTTWALNMLLKWSRNDPVSDIERARNEAVCNKQHNRNPFIDYPGLEEYIWGTKTSVAFSYDNYAGGGDTETLVAPTFTPAGGTYSSPLTVQITTPTTDAEIYYSIDDEDFEIYTGPLTVTTSCVLTAFARKDGNNSSVVIEEYIISGGGDTPAPTGNTYVRVESAAELAIGGEYLIVCEGYNKAMSGASGDIRGHADVTIQDKKIETETGGILPHRLLLGGAAGAYTFQDQEDKTYLALTTNGNKLNSVTTTSNNTNWTVTIAAGDATISSNAYPSRSIKYNAGSPRFATYTTGQQSISLYKRTGSTGIAGVLGDSTKKVNVYTVDGRKVRSNVKVQDAMQGLKPGIYVVNGRKVLKR